MATKSSDWALFDWQSLKPKPVIGVDEVGRGCLAGPVYAAAVIINEKNDFSEYTDSKKMTEKRRETLCAHIQEHHLVGVGFATVEEIDRINILQASLLAMKRAILKLGQSSGHVLVDGNQKVPHLQESFVQTTLVKGDLRATPVAAASIVAKVTRDRLLKEMGVQYPGYGFEKHKGYSTKVHKEAIAEYGPCPEHRSTFSGVKEFL